MNGELAPDLDRRERDRQAMLARPINVTVDDELEFQAAMERYKASSGRPFPTWSEVFEVLVSLGYAKRIWKPVTPWVPVRSIRGQQDSHSPEGWYATAETSVSS